MQETKITRGRIKNHFTYSWWKYVLLACIAIFGWNLIYTASAYRPPKEKRLDIYFVMYSLPEEVTEWFSDEILARYPEVEESNVLSIVYTDEDNYYGSIQLTTYMGAAEGDVYILPRERFETFAESGAFYPLDEAIDSGTLDLRGVDVASAIRTDEEGATAVYGIPLDSLYGLMEHGIDNRGMVACVMSYSSNMDRAVDWIGWLIDTMQADKPEWLVEQEATKPTVSAEEDISSY